MIVLLSQNKYRGGVGSGARRSALQQRGGCEMDRKAVRGIILPEEGYAEAMETVVEPYLAERMMTEFCERENGKRIFYARCLADQPRGVVIISHGYTETVENTRKSFTISCAEVITSLCQSTAGMAAVTECAVIQGIYRLCMWMTCCL